MAEQKERIVLEVDERGVVTAVASANKAVAGLEVQFARAGQTLEQRLLAKIATLRQRMTGDPMALKDLDALQQRVLTNVSRKLDEAGSIGRKVGDAIRNPLQAAGAAAEKFVASLGTVGGIAVGAAAGLGLAAKAAFGLVQEMGRGAEETVNLAERLGTTAQQADRLRAMSAIAGVNVGALESGMRRLSQALDEGSEEGRRGQKVLRDLGIAAQDSRGRLRPMFELIEKIGSAIGGIEDPARRARMATDVFGRGALELLPLFRNWRQLSRDVGAGMDEDLIRALARADDQIDKLRRSWQLLKGEMAGGILAVVNVIERIGGGKDRRGGAATILTRGAGISTHAEEIRSAARGAELPELFPSRTARANLETIERESIARGTSLIEAFKSRLAQGDEAMKRRLTEIKQLREAAEARLMPGLQADVAATRIRDVEKLAGEERALEAAIKARAEAERKADEQRRLAAKWLPEVRRLQEGAPREVKLSEDVLRAEERRGDFQAREFQKRLGEERQLLDLQVENIRSRFEIDDAALDQRKQQELRQLEFLSARTLEEKIALEERKAEIEERYLVASFERKAAALEREQQFELAGVENVARRSEIIQRYTERGRSLTMEVEADIAATRDAAAIRSVDLYQREQERAFEDLKRGFEGLFDAAFTRASSFVDALKEMFLSVFLAPIKRALADWVAGLFTGITRNAPLGGVGRAGGIFGTVGTALAGSTAGFGGGGAGGMGSGAGGAGGLAGLLGMGASAIPGLALGGAALGLTGAYRLGQGGSIAGRALAPALGAVSGLLGFGALSYLFPSLIAAGPVGWIIAGGIGAFMGMLGMFRKTAEQKAKEKIRAVYGIDVQSKGILQQIVGIAKQSYGGDLDAAIRAREVRELIELYAMSTGQRFQGAPRQTPGILAQSGGAIYQAPQYWGGALQPAASAALPSLPAPTPRADLPAERTTFVIRLDGTATTALLRGEAVEAIAEHPREVAAASLRAARASSGRREFMSLQFSPGALTE